MKYAKVIVDVAAKATDRPYDYRIPQALAEFIDVGSRVGVPFGPRILQGFVVELVDNAELHPDKVKNIVEVLDLEPPLTAELVKLSRWMSFHYVCHEITALQAMIPGALKSKYEKHIVAGEFEGSRQGELMGLFTSTEQEIFQFVQDKGTLLLESLLLRFKEDAKLIKQMIREGKLLEVQTMKDRVSQKKALTVFLVADPSEVILAMGSLSASARRQRDVLQFLMDQPEPIRLAELTATLGISSGTVKSLADKGLIAIRDVEMMRDPYANRIFEPTQPMSLTEQQQQAYDVITDGLEQYRHEVHLLQGVTGSGKTEVYLQSIQQCLDQGREAIVLVPEISLTPQMVERFKGRFGNLVAVLHSRLSQGERYDEWRKIQHQQVKVAIGARSAIFAPFRNIGLIIIDEEHESSYKQEESPKYHARDVAIERAKAHNAVVVLGSATPSLETFYQTTRQGERRISWLTMTERVEGRPLPKVKVVDLREELKAGNRSMFSRELYKAIEIRLEKKEQMVLLLNRRGYSTFVMCRSCGYVAQCPHCDISLTYHQNSRNLRCHYCGYAEKEPQVCPECGSEHIRFFGTGTQRVEEELVKLFPGIRVIRMDVDTTSEKGSHEKWLTQFGKGQADVLLGTQMVAKGLDFPNVTLVGVIAADTVLNLPDFRAAEKTFQLMTQVAGRAGRHQLPGEVVIQSYTPEHYSIEYASNHDYMGFVRQELEQREQRGYPPYYRLILLTISHEQIPVLIKFGEALASLLKERVSAFSIPGGQLQILGPVASPIPRIKDRYRFQCMVKYRGDVRATELVRQVIAALESEMKRHSLLLKVDVDPQILM